MIRFAIIFARPVLPEPGMPLTAIIRRVSAGVVRSLAAVVDALAGTTNTFELSFVDGWNIPMGLLTPGFGNQSVYLVFHDCDDG